MREVTSTKTEKANAFAETKRIAVEAHGVVSLSTTRAGVALRNSVSLREWDLLTRTRNCGSAKISARTVQATMRGSEHGATISGTSLVIWTLQNVGFRSSLLFNDLTPKAVFLHNDRVSFPGATRSEFIAATISSTPCNTGAKTLASVGLRRPVQIHPVTLHSNRRTT